MIDAKEMFGKRFKSDISTDDLIEAVLSIEDIREFAMKYDLTHEQLEQGLGKFLQYKDDTYINKDGERESKSVPGYRMILEMNEGTIQTSYIRVKNAPKKNKIQCFNIPKELLNASFENFSLSTEERRKAYKYARKFVTSFKTPDQLKGMYLAGNFRCGKTYLASAIGNELAEKNYSVIEIYYPELSSLLKNTFGQSSENSFYEIVEELKTCDLLILDDFGGEAINPYIRDEALGVVLNYRMVKNKPVIFTSNVPRGKLQDWSLRKDGSEAEKVKALRIYERIVELTESFTMTEKYQESDNDLF